MYNSGAKAGERLKASMGATHTSAASSEMNEAYSQMAAEYKEVYQALKAVGEGVKTNAQQNKEAFEIVRARLQAVEQAVADGEGFSASGGFGSDGQSFGVLALHNLDENPGFSDLKSWNQGSCRMNLTGAIRAALTNENGTAGENGTIPSNPERGAFYTAPQRPLRLLDVLPHRPTSADSIEFIQLIGTGDAGEQVEEGDEKAEFTTRGELTKVDVVTIAAHTTASRQVLNDHSTLQREIDRMSRYKLLSRLEHQIINGPGGQGKITGLMNAGVDWTPTDTAGGSPADILGEAVMEQKSNGFEPNVIVMNPSDWFIIQITKSEQEGEYLFGSPTNPTPPSLWNIPIVLTSSMEKGQALVLDTAHVTVVDREQPSVMLSNSHKDYFTRNLVLMLGELRACLEVLITSAVLKVNIGTVPEPTSGS